MSYVGNINAPNNPKQQIKTFWFIKAHNLALDKKQINESLIEISNCH